MSTGKTPNRTATRKPTFPQAGDLRNVLKAAQQVSYRRGVLSLLLSLGDVRRAVEAAEISAVSVARLGGRSWSEIGAALGTSKQAAQQRFGDKIKEP